jgi:F1F0 ATPase subunit 2
MDNLFQTILSLAVGLVLGLLFYGGLWITVRRIQTSPHPGLLTFGGLWIRMGLVLAGLLLVLHGRWQNALVYLIGLIAARLLLSRFLTCR